MLVALAASVGLFFASLLLEPKNPVELRRLGAELRAGRIARVAELVPRWAVTFAVAALRATAEIHILEADNVATSFPGFDALMRGLGLQISATE